MYVYVVLYNCIVHKHTYVYIINVFNIYHYAHVILQYKTTSKGSYIAMVSNSEKLSKWAILSLQEPTFLDSVKLAYVCDAGNQAFLITEDDDVYTIGNNMYIRMYAKYT